MKHWGGGARSENMIVGVLIGSLLVILGYAE